MSQGSPWSRALSNFLRRSQRIKPRFGFRSRLLLDGVRLVSSRSSIEASRQGNRSRHIGPQASWRKKMTIRPKGSGSASFPRWSVCRQPHYLVGLGLEFAALTEGASLSPPWTRTWNNLRSISNPWKRPGVKMPRKNYVLRGGCGVGEVGWEKTQHTKLRGSSSPTGVFCSKRVKKSSGPIVSWLSDGSYGLSLVNSWLDPGRKWQLHLRNSCAGSRSPRYPSCSLSKIFI